jgi:two-component system invasion response regulator UvrY
VRVLVVDDHPVVIFGCQAALSTRVDIEMISASDAKEGYALFSTARPDVIVIDAVLPDGSGFDLAKSIIETDPNARIIIFTVSDEAAVAVGAIKAGAKGYLGKGDAPFQLVKAVEEVSAGRTYLTPEMAQKMAFLNWEKRDRPKHVFSLRELTVLRLLRQGDSMLEIAEKIEISYKTVSNTCVILKRKLGARTLLDLMRMTIDDELA